MAPNDSASAFELFVAARGIDLSKSTPRDGIEQMLSFYRSMPASGCAGPDGDMLLFQWGTYDWGEGRHFEIGITRQFIEQDAGEDDDAISQLSLTYRFEPTPERVTLGDGNRWCHGPAETASFRASVLSSPPCVACGDMAATVVEIVHSRV